MKRLFKLSLVFLFIGFIGCGFDNDIQFPSSNPIGPPPEVPSGDRGIMASVVATVTTAPTGTEKRESTTESWETASAEDQLALYNEIRNIYSTEYEVSLESNACMEFDDYYVVTLADISGDVEYKDGNEEWIAASGTGEYGLYAVKTGGNGSVSVITSLKGAFPPPPLPDTTKH